jgi:murein hydrolase activator
VLVALRITAGEQAGEEPLERIQADLERLDREQRALEGREHGILGELRRVELDLRRGEAVRERLALEVGALTTELEAQAALLAQLETQQARRRGYLAFRLREQYKDGPQLELRRLAARGAGQAGRAGGRYVEYLGERDRRVLAAYRAEVEGLTAARSELTQRRALCEGRRAEAEAAQVDLEASLAARARLLARVRDDRATREGAIAELERAAHELTERVEGLGPTEPGSTLDVHKFRGLLDWPARGRVSAEFGNVVHPRFRTTVPHPGLDIEGGTEEEIRTVFDGRVAFASWMRGYGLTALVDHGGGLISVYAHAAVLTVETGEIVARGQAIGRIGDSGSLRGTYLYFEIREAGLPVDPRGWLRPH